MSNLHISNGVLLGLWSEEGVGYTEEIVREVPKLPSDNADFAQIEDDRGNRYTVGSAHTSTWGSRHGRPSENQTWYTWDNHLVPLLLKS